MILKRSYNVIKHLLFKVADRSLLGGSKVTTGNRISEFGNKNRRRFWPSIHKVKLHSEILNKQLEIRVTPKVLKTIDAIGGLDSYILNQRVLESKKALTIKHTLAIKKWTDDLKKLNIPLEYSLNPIQSSKL